MKKVFYLIILYYNVIRLVLSMDKEKKEEPTTIRFPLGLKEDIKKAADKQNRTFSNWVITACIEQFKKNKK